MNCRGCDKTLPKPFLQLGHTPLANSYKETQDAWQATAPLELCFCPMCYLVQLNSSVLPEEMFLDYAYASGHSPTFIRHTSDLAEEIIRKYNPVRVLEIGSNDGTLLQHFKQNHVSVLGIDPSINQSKTANDKGLTTITGFFGDEEVTCSIINNWKPFEIILGLNVMAHVPDINGFISTVKKCLTPCGVAIFEFPYAVNMMEHNEFDTIYHEHVFYYSVIALKKLFERHKMEIFNVKFTELHGGSIRIYVSNKNAHEVSSVVSLYEFNERLLHLDDSIYYEGFKVRVNGTIQALHTLLRKVHTTDNIAAYGAPAKGNTLINCAGISEYITFTVDKNPDKIGKFLPGSGIPIKPVEYLKDRNPDYLIVLPWNFKDEIMEEQHEFKERGGEFIIPIPYPVII